MKPCLHPIEAVLPHAQPMILLDEIVGYDEESLTAGVRIRPGIPFYRPGCGVPAHIGLEWMAQTCGAFAGVKARDAGGQIQVGLLLGTRNFTAILPWFVNGDRLTVTATQMFNDEQIGAFECMICRSGDDTPVAKAQLTVFRPKDGAAMFTSKKLQVPS
jgi:predicted hotdog family 3-hydroxylacyl-ACP dehydratase